MMPCSRVVTDMLAYSLKMGSKFRFESNVVPNLFGLKTPPPVEEADDAP